MTSGSNHVTTGHILSILVSPDSQVIDSQSLFFNLDPFHWQTTDKMLVEFL